MDHDLSPDGGVTGMDLIESEGLNSTAFLVTGRANENALKAQAQARSIRVIDKLEMANLRFRITEPEVVLIDDARANRLAWEVTAKQKSRKITTFESGDEFFHHVSSFSPSTPIYVDYFFNGQALGAAIAEKIVGAGFSNIFLATPYAKEKITLPLGGRDVVSKQFPDAI